MKIKFVNYRRGPVSGTRASEALMKLKSQSQKYAAMQCGYCRFFLISNQIALLSKKIKRELTRTKTSRPRCPCPMHDLGRRGGAGSRAARAAAPAATPALPRQLPRVAKQRRVA